MRFLPLLLICVLVMPLSAQAQTLHDAVEAAWSRNPDIQRLIAKRPELAARLSSARSWTPAPPTISLSHVTDQLEKDRRFRETELEISTPLWLPGEGTAQERVAAASADRTEAQLDAIKLRTAGEVREAAWAVTSAETELTAARHRLELARPLTGDAIRRQKAGDLSATDALLARSAEAEAEAVVQDRSAVAGAARLSFMELTGFENLSGSPVEVAGKGVPIDRHPALIAAQKAIDAANAELRLAGIADRDSPELGVVARRSRDIGGSVYDNSVGLRLKIPLGSEARNKPRLASAHGEIDAARTDYAAIQQHIVTARQKAEAALYTAREQAMRATSRYDLEAERATTLEKAGRTGGLAFAELLRARAALSEIDQGRVRAEVAVSQAISMLNQAYGILP